MLYADDTGIVSKSAENLAKISVIVTVFAPADLTVPEPKTEKMQFRTLNKVFLTPPLLIEAAGQIYIYIYIYICRRCIFCTWARSYQRKRRHYAVY